MRRNKIDPSTDAPKLISQFLTIQKSLEQYRDSKREVMRSRNDLKWALTMISEEIETVSMKIPDQELHDLKEHISKIRKNVLAKLRALSAG